MRKIVGSMKIALLCMLLALPGCGGGGGGTGTLAVPTQAAVTLTTQAAAPLTTGIGGVELYLVLPPGVSVKTDGTGKTSNGVLAATGSALGPTVAVIGNYPVSDLSGNTNCIKIAIVNPDGFGAGDFLTVTCDLASGVAPQASAFQVTGFTPVDVANGNPITGTSAALSVTLK